jgi:hypothetical protein
VLLLCWIDASFLWCLYVFASRRKRTAEIIAPRQVTLTYLLKWDNLFPFIWQTELLQGNGDRGRCVHTTKTSKPFSVREVSILTAACWQPSWLVTAVSDTVHTAYFILPALLLYVGRDSSVDIVTRYGLDGLGIKSWGGGWSKIFHTCPDQPWVPPGGKMARAWYWPPTPQLALTLKKE